jgi:hypothetical protein
MLAVSKLKAAENHIGGLTRITATTGRGLWLGTARRLVTAPSGTGTFASSLKAAVLAAFLASDE